IIREVFVKLLLKSSGKLSIRHGLNVTIVCYMLLAIVVDCGTRSIPLFVVLERDHLKALMDCDYIRLGCVDGKVPFHLSSADTSDTCRVDVRTYLLGGAIDGSEANGIIHDPKLELESSHFTFDLVPLSYESVDVVVGENWLLRHKAEMVCHEKVVKMPWNCKVRVGSNGNLLWKASVLLGKKKIRDDVAQTVFRMRNGHVEVYGYAFWSKEEYESHVKMIMESLKEDKIYVKFTNNVEAKQRGRYLDVEGIKWVMSRSWHCRKEQTIS
ncbi:putative reverse transcriptase domain-containing protein, partial [Tanacetum coccineum]